MLGAGGPFKLPLPEQNYLPVSARITQLSEPSELIQILALVPGLQEGDSLHFEIVLSGISLKVLIACGRMTFGLLSFA